MIVDKTNSPEPTFMKICQKDPHKNANTRLGLQILQCMVWPVSSRNKQKCGLSLSQKYDNFFRILRLAWKSIPSNTGSGTCMSNYKYTNYSCAINQYAQLLGHSLLLCVVQLRYFCAAVTTSLLSCYNCYLAK